MVIRVRQLSTRDPAPPKLTPFGMLVTLLRTSTPAPRPMRGSSAIILRPRARRPPGAAGQGEWALGHWPQLRSVGHYQLRGFMSRDDLSEFLEASQQHCRFVVREL